MTITYIIDNGTIDAITICDITSNNQTKIQIKDQYQSFELYTKEPVELFYALIGRNDIISTKGQAELATLIDKLQNSSKIDKKIIDHFTNQFGIFEAVNGLYATADCDRLLIITETCCYDLEYNILSLKTHYDKLNKINLCRQGTTDQFTILCFDINSAPLKEYKYQSLNEKDVCMKMNEIINQIESQENQCDNQNIKALIAKLLGYSIDRENGSFIQDRAQENILLTHFDKQNLSNRSVKLYETINKLKNNEEKSFVYINNKEELEICEIKTNNKMIEISIRRDNSPPYINITIDIKNKENVYMTTKEGSENELRHFYTDGTPQFLKHMLTTLIAHKEIKRPEEKIKTDRKVIKIADIIMEQLMPLTKKLDTDIKATTLERHINPQQS